MRAEETVRAGHLGLFVGLRNGGFVDDDPLRRKGSGPQGERVTRHELLSEGVSVSGVKRSFPRVD